MQTIRYAKARLERYEAMRVETFETSVFRRRLVVVRAGVVKVGK